MKTPAIALLLLMAASVGAYWSISSSKDSQLGLASARTDASASVNFDWALAEGELMLGTSSMNVPRGINVQLTIDNDRADTLLIKGYDIAFELPADSVVPVSFYTHKKGRFEVVLKTNKQPLGTLTVVEPQ